MITIDSALSWVRSFGIGGAFFILSVGTLAICGMALRVVLMVIKRGKP